MSNIYYKPKLGKIEAEYYMYNNHKYFIYFPYDWATSMEVGSGPQYCKKCREHGFVDDIFIGYCAIYIYDNARGHGFINGRENINILDKETSASFTYLKYTNHATVLDNLNKSCSEKRKRDTFYDKIDIIIDKIRSMSSSDSFHSMATSNSELSDRQSM